MTSDPLRHFGEVWLCDFEFQAPNGERPEPVCMVAQEVRSGQIIKFWREELRQLPQSPFPVNEHSLFVAYYATAELGCFKSLGWPMPCRVLDLYVEFRNIRSGLGAIAGYGLIGALTFYGLSTIDAAEKSEMRSLIMEQDYWSETEQSAILAYCQTDVNALYQLLPAMIHRGDISERTLPYSLIRGRYLAAVSEMEWTGIPIDIDYLTRFRDRWSDIREQLITRIDRDYDVYEGSTFKMDRFERWAVNNSIHWPQLETGKPKLDDETFREMARTYQVVAPLRELRTTLSQLRELNLPVGRDGRNRCLLSPFASKTGRNQPSNTRFAFGPATWIRSLIRPKPGMALAYIDWSQQELAIAGALSGDEAMMNAYRTGDFYLAAAIAAGVAPANATKMSHPTEREQFKIVSLGTQYGMTAYGIAAKLNLSLAHGQELIRRHQRTFPKFWEWSDQIADTAVLRGNLETVFGWRVHIGTEPNPRSFRNFPMQANGAEMMRLACSMLTERGIHICCPVHDALLIEATVEEIEEVVRRTQAVMTEAANIVLAVPGFELQSEAKIVRYPDRYWDPRGVTMWRTVCELAGLTP